MDFLKSTSERAGLPLLLFLLIVLLGYGYVSDRISSSKYRCDYMRAADPKQRCPQTFWSSFHQERSQKN